MRITKRQLGRIIKEEKAKILKEQRGGRDEAFVMLDQLRDQGIGDTAILEYIIGDHLSGGMAYEVISGYWDEL